jgi:AbrB family looped-hinge helix DNA binding protein
LRKNEHRQRRQICHISWQNAILIAMELSIDKFGRVVLPKKLRDHLGARVGLKVEVFETADGLLLKPVRHTSALIHKNGILVHQGQPSPDIAWPTLVEDERDERIRKIWQS